MRWGEGRRIFFPYGKDIEVLLHLVFLRTYHKYHDVGALLHCWSFPQFLKGFCFKVNEGRQRKRYTFKVRKLWKSPIWWLHIEYRCRQAGRRGENTCAPKDWKVKVSKCSVWCVGRFANATHLLSFGALFFSLWLPAFETSAFCFHRLGHDVWLLLVWLWP